MRERGELLPNRQSDVAFCQTRGGENIFLYQEDADVMFNSALIYELAVLKQYAEPILFGIDKECEEYTEAKRLLKFLEYFVGVEVKYSKNSLLREFLGMDVFKYSR